MRRYERRIWGWFYVLLNRKHFKVKLLCFYPNGACSKQYHNYRNELWLILKGNGHMNRNPLEAGEWAMIEAQSQHQYIAQKKTYVLEIQYGAKCEELDIVRF